MLYYLLIALCIIGITLLIIGIFKRSKKISFTGVLIIIISIACDILIFAINIDTINEEESNLINEVSEVSSDENNKIVEYYKKRLEEIPKKITAEEAAKRDFFVFDGVSGKVYNEERLKSFKENTKIDAENRKKDEIIIAIYNINGDPTFYDLGYGFDENTGFVLAVDSTRVDLAETEIATSNNIPEEYFNIVVNTNFPKENYEVKVEDSGFSSNIIYLKSNSNEFEDVEIGRYMID